MFDRLSDDTKLILTLGGVGVAAFVGGKKLAELITGEEISWGEFTSGVLTDYFKRKDYDTLNYDEYSSKYD